MGVFMKKSVLSVAIIVMLFTFSSCSLTKFDGTRTGNESQLIMEYKVLNTTDSQMLELYEDDIVDFAIVSDSGKLDIVLQKEGDEPIYKGVDIPTSSFQVVIGEAGTYKVSVTGKNARGSICVIVIESE